MFCVFHPLSLAVCTRIRDHRSRVARDHCNVYLQIDGCVHSNFALCVVLCIIHGKDFSLLRFADCSSRKIQDLLITFSSLQSAIKERKVYYENYLEIPDDVKIFRQCSY